jgi:hypothetical protein
MGSLFGGRGPGWASWPRGAAGVSRALDRSHGSSCSLLRRPRRSRQWSGGTGGTMPSPSSLNSAQLPPRLHGLVRFGATSLAQPPPRRVAGGRRRFWTSAWTESDAAQLHPSDCQPHAGTPALDHGRAHASAGGATAWLHPIVQLARAYKQRDRTPGGRSLDELSIGRVAPVRRASSSAAFCR